MCAVDVLQGKVGHHVGPGDTLEVNIRMERHGQAKTTHSLLDLLHGVAEVTRKVLGGVGVTQGIRQLDSLLWVRRGEGLPRMLLRIGCRDRGVGGARGSGQGERGCGGGHHRLRKKE